MLYILLSFIYAFLFITRLILLVFTLTVIYRAECVVFLIIIIVIIIITRKKCPFLFGHSCSLNKAKSSCITVSQSHVGGSTGLDLHNLVSATKNNCVVVKLTQ